MLLKQKGKEEEEEEEAGKILSGKPDKTPMLIYSLIFFLPPTVQECVL